MTTIHPFEIAGMGQGPYSFVGYAKIPSNELAGQNPDAYNNALRALPVVKAGMGTCAACGMAIMHVFVVKDGNGDCWGVGSSCIEKTGDEALCDPVKVAAAKAQREARRVAREAKRERDRKRWLDTVVDGVSNRDRLQRQQEQHDIQLRARQREQVERAKVWFFMLPLLDSGSPWCKDIAAGIANGQLPQGRAVDILRDVWGKGHGRRGTKAYEAAVSDFDTRVSQGETSAKG